MRTFEVMGYAHVEIMGHREHYGLLSEVEVCGAKMMLVEVPHPDTRRIAEQHLYSSSAIFCITKSSEEAVLGELRRRAAMRSTPKALPYPVCDCEDDERDEGRVPMDAIDTDPDEGV